jgi:hypothetical protein
MPGARQGLDQHALERTLPELAHEQPHEEVLLVSGCSCQQVIKQTGAVTG